MLSRMEGLGNPTIMEKTLFSGINDRLVLEREDGDIAFFHALMYKLEFLTKVITAGVVACLRDDTNRHRYTLEHKLVRADSIGTWSQVLNEALVGSPADSRHVGARDLAKDLTERVSLTDWRYAALEKLGAALQIVGTNVELSRKEPLRRFFEIGAVLRNRSRGHGAITATQSASACPHLEAALEALETNAVILRRTWVHLHQNLSKKYRVTPLLNDPSPFSYLKRTREAAKFSDGVYMYLDSPSVSSSAPVHVRLLFTDADFRDVWLPNGNYRKGTFELFSYVFNDTRQEDASYWSAPPAMLPESHTTGAGSLEITGNIFTNAPSVPTRYISRPHLESRLANELMNNDRHPMVTLTGRGGIGKTTLALKAIDHISRLDAPPYDVVLWISSRDIDLLDSGPKPVSQRVFDQRDVARAAVQLLEPQKHDSNTFSHKSFFQACLKDGALSGPTLFVLDNFETLNSPEDVFEWVDTHVRPPNKVLITTRFRDFKGDYPIDVGGMSDDEASKLIDEHAAWLGIGSLLTSTFRDAVIKESEGHPYVIKIMLGQAAKDKTLSTPRRVVANADHLLDALFKRTYDALSHAAQRVFLLLSSWNVHVPEVAVEAVMLRPGNERFDVADALNEVVRYSLVERTGTGGDDGQSVGAPLPAAMFGRRELKVSAFKTSVEADRQLLMDFGPGKINDAHRGALPRIENLIKAVATRASSRPRGLEQDLPVLEYLAKRCPRAYPCLADLVLEIENGPESIEKAKGYLRNFIQDADISEKRSIWLRLGELCQTDDDASGAIHAFSEAALLPTTTLNDLSNDANRMNNFIGSLKVRRREHVSAAVLKEPLSRITSVMNGRIAELSATDCSRLAWLYWNVANTEKALDIARLGVEREPNNYHCQRLIERLTR